MMAMEVPIAGVVGIDRQCVTCCTGVISTVSRTAPSRRLPLRSHARPGSMLGMLAFTMIGEHLDHPTLIDMTVAAALDHHFQLGFQSRQAADTLLDIV